jgi:hypothetical protein
VWILNSPIAISRVGVSTTIRPGIMKMKQNKQTTTTTTTKCWLGSGKTPGEKVKWYSHCEKQYVHSSKNRA